LTDELSALGVGLLISSIERGLMRTDIDEPFTTRSHKTLPSIGSIADHLDYAMGANLSDAL
jgi:hypothetical protein